MHFGIPSAEPGAWHLSARTQTAYAISTSGRVDAQGVAGVGDAQHPTAIAAAAVENQTFDRHPRNTDP